MFNKNKIFGIILWISHFFTDAIASFVLTSISLVFLSNYSSFWFNLFVFFIIYNLIAFWGQSVIWYFLDKIKNIEKSFIISKNIIIFSFLFYLIWLEILIKNLWNINQIYLIISVIFIWLGSAFFHIWWWNISLLSENKKASILWLFASGGVVWLSFWFFIARYYPQYYFLFFIVLILLSIIIFSFKNFSISEKQKNEILQIENKKIYFLIIFLLFLILAVRSAFWTNYQYLFFNDKIIIFYLAISAFLWKIIWWFLEDSKFFKNKYFIFVGIISFLFIFSYYFIYKNIILILIWIFWLTLFISPVTIILNNIFQNKKAIIISYSFWLSLILGYIIFKFFYY